MKITIPAHRCYQYQEVHEVTEYRNGCVYATEPLGVVIATNDPDCIAMDFGRYQFVSISANPGREYTFELCKAQKFGK